MGVSELAIYTLGTFTVYRGDHRIEPAEWRTERNKTLLKIFITAPGVTFPTDTLIEFMWAEAGSESHLTNLRGRVSELRRILEPSLENGSHSTFIKTARGGYQLDGSTCFIDSVRFAELAQEGLSHRGGDDEKARTCLKRAADLYRGPFLPGNLHDEWSIRPRRELESTYRHLLANLSELLYRQSAFPDALHYAELLQHQDPTREDAYRMAMSCYEQMGDPASALEVYEQCYQALKARDLVPSDRTEALFQRMRQRMTRQGERDRIHADIRALEARLKDAAGGEIERRIDLLLSLNERLRTVSESARQAEVVQEACRLAQTAGDTQLCGRAWHAWAQLRHAQGRLHEALDAVDVALRHYESANDDAGVAAAKALRGKVQLDWGDYEAADLTLDEGIAGIQWQPGQAAKRALLDLWFYAAQLERRRQAYGAALGHLDQALLIAERLDAHDRMPALLLSVGALYYHWEKPAQAKLAWEQAYERAHRLGRIATEARALNNLGICYTVSGQLERALTALQRAAELHEKAQDVRGLADVWDGLGNVYNILGLNERAKDAYLRSLDYSQQADDAVGTAMAWTNVGTIYGELDDHDTRRRYLEQALTTFRQQGDRWWEVQVLHRLAHTYGV
ncbi:MAG: tetratricopeptide repeat protein [Salinibacter sp.]